MNEKLQEIKALEDEYGILLFGMALSHLVDVGVRHLTDENVEAAVQKIKADSEVCAAKGERQFMTPEFQCAIVRCAAELAKINMWSIFAYIKKYMPIGGYGNG